MARVLKGAPKQTQQIATGLRITRSLYGAAIPVPYGRTRGAPLLIWADNFQAHPAGGKSTKGKKGTETTYTVDADMLVGFGPIQTIAALWMDNETHSGMFSSQTFTGTGPATTFNFTVTNNVNHFWAIIGVTYEVAFSVSYNDYGGHPASSSGVSEQPLYNQQYPAPNSGDWAQDTALPYAIYNATFASKNVTVVFPTIVSGITVHVYYKESKSDARQGIPNNPLTYKNLEFERYLGSGGEGAPITYVDFSGVGMPTLDLGAANVLPGFSFEHIGLYSYGPTGDCNPADIVADIICSGTNLIGWAGTFPPPVWQHGLNLSSLIAPNATGGTASTGPYNPAYSKYGGILDDEPNLWGATYSGGTNPGLNLYRNFCQSFGIYLSFYMDSQQNAAQYLDDLMEMTGSAGCWDGAQIGIIPYCEQSNYGNGASYVSPTAAGPVCAFTDDDYIKTDKEGDPKPPVEVTRKRPNDNYNSITITFTDRFSSEDSPNEGNYDNGTALVTDQADVTVQGPMPGQTKDFSWIQYNALAVKIGWMVMRRNLLVSRRAYKWKASSRFGFLTLMNLVTLKEVSLPGGIADVRITKITENEDFSLDFEAEPFIYGSCVPVIPNVTPASGGGVNPTGQGTLAGSVNAPIIFETVPSYRDKPQIEFAVSGVDPNYGGATIWMSTDGGSTYEQVGRVAKNNQGFVYSTNFPNHVDPDTVNTLRVDLTESLGTLATFTVAQRDLYQSLFYLEGGGTVGGGGGGGTNVTNIQNFPDSGGGSCTGPCWQWNHDAGTPGTATGSSSLVASPSLSGSARQFNLSWTAFGGEIFHSYLGPGNLDPNSTSFIYDIQVYPTNLTNINQMEMDLNQVMANGQTVIFGCQMNFASGLVQYTLNIAGHTQWVNSNIACTRPSINTWHHIRIGYHRDSVGNVTYDFFEIDGALSNFIGASGNSAFSLGWSPVGLLLVNFQMNGNNTSNSTTTYIDQFSISTGSGGIGLTIPYELGSYGTATLAAANKYSLPPTLRRGVYGTPIVAHNIGSDFAYLGDRNVFDLPLLQSYIGVTLHFKFTAFNQFGGSEQQLSDPAVIDYTFTPTGQVGWSFSAAGTPTGGVPFPTGGPDPTLPPGAGEVNDWHLYAPGKYDANQILLPDNQVESVTLPAGLVGSVATCDIAPTGAVFIRLYKNGIIGTLLGTVDFGAGSNVGTFTFATDISLTGPSPSSDGDQLTFVAPATPDGTFSGVSISLKGTRS